MFHALTDLLKTKGLGFAVVNDEILISKIGNPALIFDATCNVDGLESLAQVKTDELLKVLQKSFAKAEVTFAKPGKYTISVRTSEPIQRKIQEKIASLSPAARR